MKMKMMTTKIIELSDVSKSYPNSESPVLKNVTLSVNAGDFIVIRGRSGIGKSTLLRIMGLLDSPSSGKVAIEGRDRKAIKDHSEIRLRKLGFVFQQFNLIPSLSNLENVELPMELAGVGGSERRARAEALLHSVELSPEKWTRYPGKISVGEQQRVAIARALANSPLAILADEPTASLDEKTSDKVMEILQEANRERKVALVLTTTSLSEEYRYSTKEFVISDGVLSSFIIR